MSYNKSREARAAAEVIATTPTTPTPTARQLGRAAFKERQAAERARSIKTWDQMSNKGTRNGKNAGLPRSFARAEARFAERTAKTTPRIDESAIEHFAGDEQYMAARTANAEINIMDIIQPARGKSARAFASERARHPDSIPYPLLAPATSLSLDDYLFEDSIPAELIAELFPADEAVRRPEHDVDSDRTDEEDDSDDAVREGDVADEEDDDQWELATVGASEFSFVSVAR